MTEERKISFPPGIQVFHMNDLSPQDLHNTIADAIGEPRMEQESAPKANPNPPNLSVQDETEHSALRNALVLYNRHLRENMTHQDIVNDSLLYSEHLSCVAMISRLKYTYKQFGGK